jgi:hypothetical protein
LGRVSMKDAANRDIYCELQNSAIKKISQRTYTVASKQQFQRFIGIFESITDIGMSTIDIQFYQFQSIIPFSKLNC